MREFLIFAGKELREHVRSFRLPAVCLAFLVFGIMSPATARYTPELLQLMGGDAGISIALPPVTVLDSYLQFFKNMNSMGVIILLLVFAGTVADEKAKGSAALMLTKGLPRPAFVLAKFAMAALVWTAAYALAALACQGYTLWLFPGERAGNLPVSFAAYWLYGLLLLALTVLASTLAKGHGLATLGAFAGWGLMLVSMIPAKLARFSPAALGAANLQLIAGAMPASDMLVPLLIAVALAGLALAGAAWAITKQEL